MRRQMRSPLRGPKRPGGLRCGQFGKDATREVRIDAGRRGARGGHTLLEVAVVTAILALLAVGIGIPAVASGRSRVQRVTCAQHLRQWGMATAIYTSDNGDRLPPDGAPNGTWVRSAWYVNLPQCIGVAPHYEWHSNVLAQGRWDDSIWICPAEARRATPVQRRFFFCLNRNVNGVGAASRGIRYAEIERPSRVPWLFDNGRRAAVAGENNAHTNAHDRGANFLMLDGAVHRLAADRYWDFARRRGLRNPVELEWRPGGSAPPDP